MSHETDPPDSDPEAVVPGPLDYDRLDDTRAARRSLAAIAKSIARLEQDSARAQGAAGVWRIVGGLAATLAIGIGGAALSLANDAAADHDRVAQHEETIEALREDVTAIRVDVSAVRARVENRREP